VQLDTKLRRQNHLKPRHIQSHHRSERIIHTCEQYRILPYLLESIQSEQAIDMHRQYLPQSVNYLIRWRALVQVSEAVVANLENATEHLTDPST